MLGLKEGSHNLASSHESCDVQVGRSAGELMKLLVSASEVIVHATLWLARRSMTSLSAADPEPALTSKHRGEEGIQDALACQQRGVGQQLLRNRPRGPHRPHLQHGVLLQSQADIQGLMQELSTLPAAFSHASKASHIQADQA